MKSGYVVINKLISVLKNMFVFSSGHFKDVSRHVYSILLAVLEIMSTYACTTVLG